MTTDTIRRTSKAWLALEVTALLACLVLGLKVLQSFLVSSSQVGGFSGLASYKGRYELARTGQLFTFLAFICFQVLGGAVLRQIAGSSSPSWSERIKSVLLFTVGFVLATGLAAAAIAFGLTGR